MKSSYIYSLSVEEILDNCFSKDDDKFVVDLNDRFVYARVVQSKDTYPDCAFFYQLKENIKKQKKQDLIPFEQALVYLDFGNIFTPISDKDDKNTATKKARQAQFLDYIENKLFEAKNDENRGLFIKFPRSEAEARFIPFDKSNSMARNCQMSFLRAEFKKEMNKHLMLDMKIESAVLNKLYAYRGLYLTGGRRIEKKDEIFELNEETVVVIKDDNSLLRVPKGTTIFTAKKSEKQTSKGYTSWKTCEKSDFAQIKKDKKTGEEIRKIKSNHFDGQGFISPEYAMYINDIMLEPVDEDGNKASFCGMWDQFHSLYNPDNEKKQSEPSGEQSFAEDLQKRLAEKYKDKMIYSMQVRLPFGKGVLHTVDFHSIIKEKMDNKYSDGIKIIDAFKRERDLNKAKIILTESMFKCKEWLENFCVKENIDDPMKYYFEQFNERNHALYISNVDTMLPHGKYTSLNYQFLNPMALSDEQLGSLVATHNEYVDKLEKNKLLQKNSLLDDLGNIDSEYADETTLSSNQEPWAEVLRHTTKIVYDKKVAGMLNGMRESRIRDILFGRFAVKGECRFLARDLMAMVAHLVKQCKLNNESLSDEQIEKFTCLALYGETFYLPGAKIKLESGQEVVLLRNPHLSRNEEWICKYQPSDDRKKYLGHLKGIVEIGYYSMANMSLGGADFDGDIVKLVADSNVVEKVKANCYKEGEELERKIPVIEIPSGGKPTTDTIEKNDYTMQYDAIKNTFSSRIGQISNATVRIGRWEYYAHYDKDDKSKKNPIQVENIENKCAEATILTGLEIDSCKNGEKPDISSVVSFKRIAKKSLTKVTGDEKADTRTKDDEIKDDGIDYLKTKNKISGMVQYNKFGTKIKKISDKKSPNEEYYIISSKTTSVKVPVNDANIPTLDKLPRIYAEKKYKDLEKENIIETDNGEISSNENIFSSLAFTEDAPKNEDVSSSVKKILAAYNNVLRLASKDYKLDQNIKNANYIKHINTILELQYDDLSDSISDYFDIKNSEGKTIASIQREAYDKLWSFAEKELEQHNKQPEENETLLREKMLNWIIDEQWQYMNNVERKKKLEEKFEITDDTIVAFFSNFACGGYKLLYYYVKEIISMFFSLCIKNENDADQTLHEEQPHKLYEQEINLTNNGTSELSTNTDMQNTYYKKFRDFYQEAKGKKIPKKTWQKELSELALENIMSTIWLNEEMISDADTFNKRAMQYVYASRTMDPNGNFFWSAFTAQDILKYIDKSPKEKKPTEAEGRGEKDAR